MDTEDDAEKSFYVAMSSLITFILKCRYTDYYYMRKLCRYLEPEYERATTRKKSSEGSSFILQYETIQHLLKELGDEQQDYC